jgi:hypothetical protein
LPLAGDRELIQVRAHKPLHTANKGVSRKVPSQSESGPKGLLRHSISRVRNSCENVPMKNKMSGAHETDKATPAAGVITAKNGVIIVFERRLGKRSSTTEVKLVKGIGDGTPQLVPTDLSF